MCLVSLVSCSGHLDSGSLQRLILCRRSSAEYSPEVSLKLPQRFRSYFSNRHVGLMHPSQLKSVHTIKASVFMLVLPLCVCVSLVGSSSDQTGRSRRSEQRFHRSEVKTQRMDVCDPRRGASLIKSLLLSRESSSSSSDCSFHVADWLSFILLLHV